MKSLVCHPGGAATNIQITTAASGKGSGVNNRVFSFITNAISQSPADGCLPLLACAVLPEAESGDFYIPGKEGLGSRVMQVPPCSWLPAAGCRVQSWRRASCLAFEPLTFSVRTLHCLHFAT